MWKYKEALCFSSRKSVVCKHILNFLTCLKKAILVYVGGCFSCTFTYLLNFWLCGHGKGQNARKVWRNTVEAPVEAFCQLVIGNGAVRASAFTEGLNAEMPRNLSSDALIKYCYLAVKVQVFRLASHVNVSNTRIAISGWLTLSAVFLQSFVPMNSLIFSQVREQLMC